MSFFLQLESSLHRIFYALRQRLRWSRLGYQENPVKKLTGLEAHQKPTVELLQQQYNPRFETYLARNNALENYHYLHILSSAQKKWGWDLPVDPVVLDVGSKNFYYARALYKFFKPQKLTGIEVDGYRIYQDLHSRYDYAQFYIKDLVAADYQAIDFCSYKGQADVITCFYPFVFDYPHVKWCLPLKLFRPQKFFDHLVRSLNPNGYVFMVNMGEEEFEQATALAKASGLKQQESYVHKDKFFHDRMTAMVSLWKVEK